VAILLQPALLTALTVAITMEALASTSGDAAGIKRQQEKIDPITSVQEDIGASEPTSAARLSLL